MASSIVPSVSRLATPWDRTGNPRERTSSLKKGGIPFAQVMMILLLFTFLPRLLSAYPGHYLCQQKIPLSAGQKPEVAVALGFLPSAHTGNF
jgi:hypothetical protein